MVLVIVLVLLVAGTLLFHFVSPWWFTTLASNWGNIDSTVEITFWVTGFVFIAVNLFMAYAIFRHRFRKDRKAHYEPENKPLELWLTVITSVGVAAMLAPGLFVWAKFVDPPEDAAHFEVLGQQWHWTFRFPGEDGQLGRTHPHFMSEQNPFGLDPDDPAGQDDRLVFNNELHLPVNQPVKALLRSRDVLHNFGVPQFRVKMDMVPGMVSYLWFEPSRDGRFDILCMELCGMAHHTMRGQVVIEPHEDFDRWLASHPTFADTQNDDRADPQRGAQLYGVCASCHGPEGGGNADMNAPRLSHLDPWYLERQLHFYKTGVRGSHEEDRFGQQMAGMMATLPDRQAMRDVSAHIDSLTSDPPDTTVTGDAQRGERLYRNCSSCHGDRGEGNYATNAPALAGQYDWYLRRQLEHFKKGVRGSHKGDYYGTQMTLMARTLHDDQAIDDLLAYLNQL